MGGQTQTLIVSQEVRNAIITNPELYLMGSMGPDAFPGIYEGQMSIHPGNPDGWGTGDWLEHVVTSAQTDEEIAFAYGMMAHAAADIWAHSYVNQYSGNAYSLTDGEVDVETRHFLLEGYIAKKMPPFERSVSLTTPTATSLLKRNGKLVVPVDFLYRIFVEDEKAAKEFANNNAPHLTAVHDLNAKLAHMARDGGPTDDLHHFIQKIIIEATTGYTIKEDELKKLNEWHQEFLDDKNLVTQDVVRLADGIRGVANDFTDTEMAQVDRHLASAHGAIKEVKKLQSKKNEIEDKILELEKKMSALIDPREEVCSKDCGCPSWDRVCKRLCKEVCKWKTTPHPSRAFLKNALREKRKTEGDLISLAGDNLKKTRKSLNDAYQFTRDLHETEAAILKGIINLDKRFTENENPIKGSLIAWKRDNENAMKAYFVANATAMTNVLDGESLLDPLAHWLKCEAIVFTSFPSEVLDPACNVLDRYDEFNALLTEIRALHPVSAELDRVINRLREEVIEAATDEGLKFATSITGLSIKEFAYAISQDASASHLNRQFETAPPDVALLKISNISQYVDQDMQLDNKGHFSPEKFPPIRNAITLTRLSLLPPKELNILIGKNKYSHEKRRRGNIMFGFAHSIDGNHQWLSTPPPYPRSDGNHKKPDVDTYSYPDELFIWDKQKRRNLLFRRIFIGPLNGGFVMGDNGGNSPIALKDYNYNPTKSCAYPDYSEKTGDDNCIKKRGWFWGLFD